MGLVITQTDTAADLGVSPACQDIPADDDAVAREATSGGTAGSTEHTFSVGDFNSEALFMCQTDPDTNEPDTGTWEAGTWTIRLNVTTANSNIEWNAVHICEIESGNTVGGTVAEKTNLQIELGATGVQSVDVSQGSDYTPTGNGSSVYIVYVFREVHGVGSQSFGIKPSEDIDTPIITGAVLNAAGSATGVADASGLARFPLSASGSATGRAAASPKLTGTFGISGQASGVAQPSGFASIRRSVSGAASGAGESAGNLAVGVLLKGAAIGIGESAGVLSQTFIGLKGRANAFGEEPLETQNGAVIQTEAGQTLFASVADPDVGVLSADATLKMTIEGSAAGAGHMAGSMFRLRLVSGSASGEGVAGGQAGIVLGLLGAAAGVGQVFGAVAVPSTETLTQGVGSIKEDAGFFWNPTAGTTRKLTLNWPLHLEPGGIEASNHKWREVAESIDYQVRETYIVDRRVDEVHATARFEDNPTDMLDLLEHLADGGTADYSTNISSTNPSRRTVELAELRDLQRLRPERTDRKAKKEFEVDLDLRSTTGDLDGLL